MKVRTTILIEYAILKQAQELGLNVSQYCENALKIGIQALTNSFQKIAQNQVANAEKGGFGTVGSEKVAGPPGFEPGISGLEVRKPTVSALPSAKEGEFKEIDWKGFEKWLLQNHRERVARDILSYARRYAHCLLRMDLSEVALLRKTLRHHVVKALSNLAKFLGVYEDYRRLVRGYGIGWTGKSVDDLVIDRLIKVKDPEQVWQWVKQVKAVRVELSEFMDFLAVTGLRLDEAVQSYNLIIRLHREGKLNQYYNEANECLEHYRFKDVFVRRTKKAFISFAPKSLIQRITQCTPLKSRHAVQKRVQDRGVAVRFSDVREAWASVLTRHLTPPEIDFLQGRVSANVFMSSYFNPALVADLKDRVFKAIAEIQSKIA
ncbi:MAG: integrase [Candidatus Bathyarchaeia archaeon]